MARRLTPAEVEAREAERAAEARTAAPLWFAEKRGNMAHAKAAKEVGETGAAVAMAADATLEELEAETAEAKERVRVARANLVAAMAEFEAVARHLDTLEAEMAAEAKAAVEGAAPTAQVRVGGAAEATATSSEQSASSSKNTQPTSGGRRKSKRRKSKRRKSKRRNSIKKH